MINNAANFDDFLDKQEEVQPSFFWYGSHEDQRVGGKKLADIDSVPTYWPDNEIVCNDMLDYGLEIDWADKHFRQMLESKKEDCSKIKNAI